MFNVFRAFIPAQKQKCAHRFPAEEVIDANIEQTTIRCLNCKVSLGKISAEEKAQFRFKYLPGARWMDAAGITTAVYAIEKIKRPSWIRRLLKF